MRQSEKKIRAEVELFQCLSRPCGGRRPFVHWLKIHIFHFGENNPTNLIFLFFQKFNLADYFYFDVAKPPSFHNVVPQMHTPTQAFMTHEFSMYRSFTHDGRYANQHDRRQFFSSNWHKRPFRPSFIYLTVSFDIVSNEYIFLYNKYIYILYIYLF